MAANHTIGWNPTTKEFSNLSCIDFPSTKQSRSSPQVYVLVHEETQQSYQVKCEFTREEGVWIAKFHEQASLEQPCEKEQHEYLLVRLSNAVNAINQDVTANKVSQNGFNQDKNLIPEDEESFFDIEDEGLIPDDMERQAIMPTDKLVSKAIGAVSRKVVNPVLNWANRERGQANMADVDSYLEQQQELLPSKCETVEIRKSKILAQEQLTDTLELIKQELAKVESDRIVFLPLGITDKGSFDSHHATLALISRTAIYIVEQKQLHSYAPFKTFYTRRQFTLNTVDCTRLTAYTARYLANALESNPRQRSEFKILLNSMPIPTAKQLNTLFDSEVQLNKV
ncbi:MAG: hypothetical protein ACPGUD_10895 [Parashewanella sp.]